MTEPWVVFLFRHPLGVSPPRPEAFPLHACRDKASEQALYGKLEAMVEGCPRG